ncbi:MAG: GTP-binding protein [Moorea sp. SIOASIH]|uniref:Rab family GTPase n=1 Tax=Moorena sp. SIOASIH TaxID=2607817 RepID=UPI0013B71631|nr:Rab family GTPase [Moorena sp. SIOASIH]NEO37226.1 GTP-binding protein [Moorena sp. SIOASIH]
MSTIDRKICLVGDFGVGKTSLIRRFVEGVFSDQYLSTVGVKISRKIIKFKDETRSQLLDIKLMIWDLEGHTKFKGISPTYLKGAQGAIIVADVTRMETIEHIVHHIDLFLSINPKGLIITALNKSDLVDQAKLEELTQRLQKKTAQQDQVIASYYTSAKTGLYVNNIFHQLGGGTLQ